MLRSVSLSDLEAKLSSPMETYKTQLCVFLFEGCLAFKRFFKNAEIWRRYLLGMKLTLGWFYQQNRLDGAEIYLMDGQAFFFQSSMITIYIYIYIFFFFFNRAS